MPGAKTQRRSSPRGQVRIVGGRWRGRRVVVADAAELRPTPDRVRETLFNWLGQTLEDCACLDLYAGSGVLGFEAASRGAARVVLVERERRVLDALQAAQRALAAAQVDVVHADALEYLAYLARANERFDVVFLDPPFRQNAWPALFERLPRCLAAGARVSVEASTPQATPPGWQELRRLRAGQVSIQLLQWGSE